MDYQFDPFSPEAVAKYSTPVPAINKVEYIDPTVIFRALRAGKNDNYLPLPEYTSPAEVRKEATERSQNIFNRYETLHGILERHEATIQKRWLKKTRQQRRKVLLNAWTDMPLNHRPDFEPLRNGWTPERTQGTKVRGIFLWPHINQEDLLNTKTLPLLLNARGRHAPSHFAAVDHESTRVGLVTLSIMPSFLDGYIMILHGMADNTLEYGRLVSWDEEPGAFDLMVQGKQFLPSEGLIILEIQERLLGFLIDCSMQILHDIDPSAITSDDFPILAEPPLKTGQELNGFDSLRVMVAEAPYRVPAKLDLSQIESLLSARASAAEDHLWALRENPDYFSHVAHEAKDHRQENLKDTAGNNHPVFRIGKPDIFWSRVISNVVSEAYIELQVFAEMSIQVNELVALQLKYASQIKPSEDLPKEYEDALLRFCFYMHQAARGPLRILKEKVPASPPLQRLFIREPPVGLHSSIIHAFLNPGAKTSKLDLQLLWLLRTLSEDDVDLACLGLPVVVDELERLLQSEPHAKELISPYISSVISDLSIVSQTLNQLYLYQPWALTWPAKMAELEEVHAEELSQRTESWTKMLAALSPKSLRACSVKLDEPSSGKFTYPIHKRRTKENVEALRQSEHSLDAFWASIDQLMITKAVDLRNTPLPVSAIYSGISPQQLDTAQPKKKSKTRGKPSPASAADTEVQILQKENQSDPQPTLSVDARALKVFRMIFFNPATTSSPGEVPWNDFLHAMTMVGFTATKLYGSVWQFRPTKLDVERSIQFHEPHPRGKMPFTTARRYGLQWISFTPEVERTNSSRFLIVKIILNRRLGKPVKIVGLTLLSDPQDAIADIVFVHGLQGHPRNTWTYYPNPSERDNPSTSGEVKKPKGLSRILGHHHPKQTESGAEAQDGIFWPEDLLKEDFPKARIMTFGYNTLVQNGIHTVNQGNLFSHARNLLYDLEAKRRKTPTRPLIFIAHSLGGIIVKEVLRRAEHDHDEKINKIYLSTTGVFFFGTPHRGSKDWASSAQVAARIIVPPESSSLDDPAQRLRALDENHKDMVKFKGRDDQGYEWVKEDIEELMEKAVDFEKRQDLVLEDGTPNEARNKCLQVFRTSNYEQFKDRNPDRLDRTCEWFLNHENFHKWRESDSSNILWVSADPGCGKSVLAKHLVDKEESLEAGRDRAVCYFFFKDDDEDQNNSATAMSAILHQLLSQRGELIPYAMKDYNAEGQNLPQLFQKLWNILLKAADDSKAGEIVCILDGLDNSVSEENNSRLKFIVTSRPYIDIERRFADLIRQFPEIRLSGEKETESISREIDKVIRSKLEKLSNDLNLSTTERYTLEKELLSMPQRTYLWATLVFEILNKTVRPTSRKLKEIIGSIPPTVDAAYESILSKIDDKTQARKLFSIVVAANRPLTLSEMNVALTIDDDHKSYEELEEDLDDKARFESTVRAIGGLFISIKDQRVYLIHQTARQFLLAENKVLDSWKHSLDPVETELIMAKSCITFLMFTEFDDGFDWEETDNVPLNEVLEFDYLDYASNFWMGHFRKAQTKTDEDLVQFVLEVCENKSRRFNIWSRLFRRFNPSSPILGLVDTMMIASYFGHDTVVNQLLADEEEHIHLTDRHIGRTSLAWAVEQGHIRVVELIVGTGKANVNMKDGRDQTPLWLACNLHQEEIALVLLENSADPMFKTDRTQSAIFESAIQGLPKVVSWILRSMSDEALRDLTGQYDSEGKSILNLAISDNRSQSKIVKIIIDALARFPDQRRKLLFHQDQSSCSPLFHAALKNQPDIIKILTKIDKELLNQRGWFGWRDTPLHVATHWQNLEAVQALLQAGANPDIPQRNGRTPLHIALERTDSPYGIKILKILLKRANPLITEENGKNILHLCLESNKAVYFDIIQDSIPDASFRQLLTSKNNRGNIPMFHAIDTLWSKGQDYALLSNTFSAIGDAMVKIISKADVNFILDLVKEKDRPIALHRFIETEFDEPVSQILTKVIVSNRSLLDQTDDKGMTFLMKAVDKKQLKTIKILLQNSAHIDAQDKDGKTALHYAVASDVPDIAELLFRANANLLIKDNYSRIPVDWCSSRNRCFKVVKPKDRPTTPNPAAITSSTRSSRSEWLMVLGAPLESCFWPLQGDRTWHPTVLRESRYVISESIPDHIKLPVSRIQVIVEGRDQGWSHPDFFGDRPEGSFTSESSFSIAILRNDQIVLQREWARNRHRLKTLHRFECTWYSDSQRNRDNADFGGRRPASPDDQGDFVRRLNVGDKVVLLALSSGEGWMNIVKSASIEIFFED
ncbi:hypothetical protein PENSTE_c012G03144 [Penicillium steckii]|uniref:Uncharacterized protein n=1 Tax=Penicillium steckii TaxID=303698 RepID=A0A1V6T460_9EURO|nr:hypothetical protein PENSTE_c012G03144 [Penicillium steckii]